jgi:formylglycine-generating enzyme required for sulfatase activity/serine/threonine protein kinase
MDEQNQAETVGQYRLTECHAEGRIARICKGVDRNSGQTVLVRIVDPLAAKNEQIRAILEELRDPNSERRVQDPHILRLLDVGLKDDRYYIIHEDFGGVPLNEYLDKGRPTLREGLRLAYSIAECLRAAHGHKIIHGDLKPQNILVGTTRHDKPHVKIALSDLAHEAADAMVSVYCELVGTPKYMAPEVLKGARATAQSDMFSLGVILYELFTGRAPFPGDTPISFIHANVTESPTPLTMADSAVPADLAKIVDRLLAKDHRNRYRNVQSVMDDLERVAARLDGITAESAPPGADSIFAPAPSEARPESNPWRAIAVIALVASAIMLIVVALLLASQPKTTKTPLVTRIEDREPAPQTNLTGVPTSLLPESQGEPPAPLPFPVDSPINRAEALIASGAFDEAIDLLRSLRTSSESAARKNEIDHQIAEAMFSKADRLDQAGKFQEAQTLLDELIAEYPLSQTAVKARNRAAEMLLSRAQVLGSRGRHEEAVAYLEKIQTIYPRSDSTYKALQLLPSMRVRFAESILDTDPERATKVLRNVAFSPASSEDVSRARAVLAKHLLDQSDALMRRRLPEEAVSALHEARRLDTSLQAEIVRREPEALGELALALKRQGKPAEAVMTFKELQEKYPSNIWVTRVRVEITPLLEATEGMKPGEHAGDASMLLTMAEKALKTGGFDTAKPHLDQLVSLYPDTPEGKRAAVVISDNLVQQAIQALRSARMDQALQLFQDVSEKYADTRAGQYANTELARFKAMPAGMSYVPAGPCTIGLSDEQIQALVTEFSIPRLMVPRWFGLTTPAHTVNLNAFYIDTCEVTNEQYKAFLDALKGREAPPSPDWNGNAIKTGAEKKPVRFVSWDDANAYASWAGKRLPTEAEWEKAARGPEGLLFPWGNTFDASRCMSGPTQSQGPLPVGSLPDNKSPYGVLDTVGNVQEWTQDSLVPYPDADPESARFNEAQKVARGSGWDEINSFFCLAAMRFGHFPDARAGSLGFRCVKDVQQ